MEDITTILDEWEEVAEEPEEADPTSYESKHASPHDLRWLVDLYYQTQKTRIAMGNRAASISRGADVGDAGLALYYCDQFAEIEQNIAKRIGSIVRQHPTWKWLHQVKGVGPVLAGKLVGLVGPDEAMERRDTVSKLWAFAGLAPGQKLVKGQKASFNRRLKSLMYVIATSMLRAQGKFAEVYYSAKEYYAANRPDWTPMHCHMAALRKMEKLFLACLWQVWRESIGQPVRKVYVVEKLGHTHVVDPWDMVG